MDGKKASDFALTETISKIARLRSDFENASQGLIGRVDGATISYYNDIVKRFDTFISMLDGQVKQTGGPAKPFAYRHLNDCVISGELSRRTVLSLIRAGISTTRDLTYVNSSELQQIRSFGRLAYFEISAYCEVNSIELGVNCDKRPVFNEGDIVVSLVDKKYMGYKDWFVKKGSRYEIIEARRYDGTGCFKLDQYKCRPIGTDSNLDFSMLTCLEIEKVKDKE